MDNGLAVDLTTNENVSLRSSNIDVLQFEGKVILPQIVGATDVTATFHGFTTSAVTFTVIDESATIIAISESNAIFFLILFLTSVDKDLLSPLKYI